MKYSWNVVERSIHMYNLTPKGTVDRYGDGIAQHLSSGLPAMSNLCATQGVQHDTRHL